MKREDMSRARAHEILTLWRDGSAYFPAHVISLALVVTGDLDASLA
jgi:hypothetical protein